MIPSASQISPETSTSMFSTESTTNATPVLRPPMIDSTGSCVPRQRTFHGIR